MHQIYITQQATLSSLIMQRVVKGLWLQCLTFVRERLSTKPAQVLSHCMAREEGKGEKEGEKKQQRSTFKLNQAEGMSWVCTEMDGSPCNIKAPCLAMPSVPLLSAAPALPASRPSTLPSRWHFKAGTQTWQAWLSAWSQPPPRPFLLFLSRPPPILPHYPHHYPHHLKETAPTPAGPGQRQDPHQSPPREPLSKNSSPQA